MGIINIENGVLFNYLQAVTLVSDNLSKWKAT